MHEAAFAYRTVAGAFETARRRMILGLKYAENQPRIPAGSPNGGQWTSGVAVSTPFELLDELARWSIASDFTTAAIFRIAEVDLPHLADTILDWLGPGAVQLNSPNGAVQFMSSHRVRKIRFDITPGTSHGEDPHINIEPGRRHIWIR